MLIIIAVVVAVVYFGNQYLRKPLGLKPILPTVFFENVADANSIVLDFGACLAEKGTVSGEFGSILIEVWSRDIGMCNFNYVYSTYKKRVLCIVPKNLGRMTFQKSPEGVNFSDLDTYCHT